MIPFCDINSVHDELENELVETFRGVLRSGHLIMGEELTAFENEFAAYCDAKHCVGVGNGLDALALALRAKGIGPGDEVIVPSQTFIATWLAVSMVGATPVPVEIDEGQYTIDPNRILEKLTPKTSAIIPVHLFGLPADMDSINSIAKDFGLFVLEDAAQSHGARCNGVRSGKLGHAAAFSFYPTKNLGGMGDGGAVVTDDDNLANNLRRLRNYGSSQKYVHEIAGVNSRLDEFQAAVLRVKLRHLDNWNSKRIQLAARYAEGLRDISGLTLPIVPPGREHVFHLYVVRTARRDALSEYLGKKGISALIHYPTAPHMQNAYAELKIDPDSLPLATQAANQTLSLPMWPQMTSSQVDTVVLHIREFMSS